MADEKDRLGETLKLLERAKEDIYFAQRDRELIEKLRAQLKKVEKEANELRCPKCRGLLETYTFQGVVLERCQKCGGIWLDNGELEAIIKQFNRVSLGTWIHKLLPKDANAGATEQSKETTTHRINR
ncbi:MAG TPA: zf-TFIIB domain-containing protein [Candidatus Binatia bacterium]